MKVVNPGDWARDALQLQVEDEDEYQQFLNGLASKKVEVVEIAKVNGSQLTGHYLFIDSRQFVIYVQKKGSPGF